MKYAYFRLFLSKIEQPAILVATGDVQERLPRDQFLRNILSQRVRFSHRSTLMEYVPIPLEAGEGVKFIFGRVGRKKETLENAAPEEKFEAKTHVGWRASNFVLDTSDHSDGQKVAMQVRTDVGIPFAILSSLFNHINQLNSDSGWHVDINPISNKASFWEAVKENKGRITRAEFVYITPNVLGIRSELNEALKRYRERENAQSVSVTLTEPRGALELDTQEVRDAVDYISEGGGSAKLKVGSEVIFDSAHRDQIKSFETDDRIEIVSAANRTSLLRKIFG